MGRVLISGSFRLSGDASPGSWRHALLCQQGIRPWIPELLTIGMPDAKVQSPAEWYQRLQDVRQTLESTIATRQAQIEAAMERQKTCFLDEGQLVLIRRTPSEAQSAHTKLTDKLDHPARIERIMPNGVAYRVVFINSGRVSIVNRRNLRPFYEDVNEEKEVFPPAHFTTLPVPNLR